MNDSSRALDLENPERFRSGSYVTLSNSNWSSLDFSHGRLGAIQFLDSSIDDCIFDDAFCEDWKLRRTQVSNSRFARTNLRGSVIGTYWEGKGNIWERVEFKHADFRDTVLRGSSFTDCEFISIKTGAQDGFIRCQFNRVTFSGRIRNLYLDMRHSPSDAEPDPGPITESDFSNAHLQDVVFRGAKLENVTFPDNVESAVQFQQ